MKKFYLFMTMALALFVGASVAWARLNPGYDAMSEVKDGDQFFIKGEYQNGNIGNPLDLPRWLGVQRPRIGEEDELIVRAYKDNVNAGDAFVFTVETAGTEIKGYPAFYLKNNLTGKYLAKSEEEAAAYESAIFLTEDKTIAAVWAFVPVNETVTAADAVVPENVLHMVTLANDGTWVYFNNNYNGNNNTWTPRVASWTDGTTCCTLYPAEVEADEEEAAISDLVELYKQATIYYGIDGVMGGTEPGYYPESVATEFNAAYVECNIDDILMKPGYTVADLISAKERLENALAEILKGPNKVKSGGYYYIVSAYTWADEQTKAVYMDNLPRWNTLDAGNAAYIWQFTELEDGDYSIKNLLTDSYVQSLTQSNAVVMGDNAEAAVRLVSLGQAQFNLIPVIGGSPFHPEGHNNGTGIAGRIVGWPGSVNSQSAWLIRAVPQSVLDELMGSVEKEQELMRLQQELIARIAEVSAATKSAFEYELPDDVVDVTPLSPDDFESNSAMLDGAPEEERHEASWGNDGQGFGALIDDNLETYFHTTWTGATIEWTAYNEDKTPTDWATRTSLHNLSMKLSQPASDVTFQVSARKGNYNNPTKIDVDASHDGKSWTPIFYGYNFFTPTTKAENPYLMGPFDLGGTYEYVRFSNYGNDRNKDGSRFFCFSELKVFVGARLTATCQASTMEKTVVENFLAAYSNANKYADVVTVDDLEDMKTALSNLNAAFAAFQGVFADPSTLTNALAEARNILDNYLEGNGQVGLYNGSVMPKDLEDAVEAGAQLLAGGSYTQETVDAATAKIKSEIDRLNATVVMPEADKWYQFQFANADEYTALGYTEGEGLIGRVASVAINAYAPAEDGIPGIVEFYPYEDEIREGANFYSADPADLPNPELSYFRFIAVGDSAYAIQNKATGLFIPYLPWSGMAHFSADPGLFHIDVLGAGFCTLSSYSLYDGTCYGGNNPNTLHFSNPAQWYEMRGWPDHRLATKSALKIVEVAEGGDIAPLRRDLNEDEAYAAVFNLDVTSFQDVKAYTVAGEYEDDGFHYIGLKEIETLPAGIPAILIGGSDVAEFTLGSNIANQATHQNGLVGTFSALTLTVSDHAAVLGFDEEEFEPMLNSFRSPPMSPLIRHTSLPKD